MGGECEIKSKIPAKLKRRGGEEDEDLDALSLEPSLIFRNPNISRVSKGERHADRKIVLMSIVHK